MKLTYQQKLDLAKWLASKNDGAITGSIMLRERGIELGREPSDIDIVVASMAPEDLMLPPLCENEEISSDSGGYIVLARCYFFGTKIEFITDNVACYHGDKVGVYPDGYRLARVSDLIEAKESYVKNDENQDYIEKTKRDLGIIYHKLGISKSVK